MTADLPTIREATAAINHLAALLAAYEKIAADMLEPTSATRGLSKLADVARFLDEVDAARGVTDEHEMQDDLRLWETELRAAMALSSPETDGKDNG